jgi:TonB family protein
MPSEQRPAPPAKKKTLVWILAGIGLLSVCLALTWGVIASRAVRGVKNAGLHPSPAPTNRTSGDPGSPENSPALAPSAVSKVEPEYSEEARSAGLEGTTVLSAVVDEKGNPKDLKTFQELGLGLDRKAIEALDQWTFRPAMKDGHAVPVQATIQVDFRLTVAPVVVAIAMSPSTPATLYAGTRGSGVFKSTNGGTSWTTVNSGLTDMYVHALAIGPSTPTTLYAGTSGSGVFKSTDGGTSWSAVNSGLTDLNVYALAIDPSTPTTLYAGTAGVFQEHRRRNELDARQFRPHGHQRLRTND